MAVDESDSRKTGHKLKESTAARHVPRLRRLSRNNPEARMAGLYVLRVQSLPVRGPGERLLLASPGREIRKDLEPDFRAQSATVWPYYLEAAANPRVSVFMTSLPLLSLRHLVRSV